MTGDLQRHWDRLGIAPTTDPAEIRRAYARQLKSVSPERDPAGFQSLRQSLEFLMARQSQACAPHPAPADPGQQEAAAVFERELKALRTAGDIRAAIALVDRLFAEHPPGHPLLAAVDALLFRTTALERTLSAELFMHLVARFDWRDASGPAAQGDPQRHSVLLSRVAAEDWYAALVADAAGGKAHGPGALPAATALARHPRALPPDALDKDQKEAARALMASLLDMGQFLLDRFDARSLAILREAVEGPPFLAAQPALAAPAPAAPPPLRKRRLSRRTMIRFAFAGAVGLSAIARLAGIGDQPPDAARSPAEQARSVLDQTVDAWVSLRPFNGQTLVYFTQLVTCRAALASVRYGLDTAVPNRDFPLPPDSHAWPQPIAPQTAVYVTAPANLRSVSVQLTYADGSMSAIHTVHQGANP